MADSFFSHLTPGGYLEQLEISPVPRSDDGSIQPGDMWDECGKLAIECGERFGKTFRIQEKMKDLISKAGFVDVVETKYKWPLGAWSTDQKLKDLGRWNLHHWNEGLEGWTMALLTRVMGVSDQSLALGKKQFRGHTDNASGLTKRSRRGIRKCA